ncbi:MAG: ferrochelatase [Planctomycetaceae bacterium]|nr:ferrochelatase [Planctomycetaceae bacterium]
MSYPYDAILVVGFGGPESRDDVIPFLENVLRGRNVPRERMLEVAEHYYHFGGVSPINQQVRDLLEVLKPELHHHGIDLPVYWGNRNWHPMLADTMQQMVDDGVQRAIAVVLAAYSSYSSCRQYREDIMRAQEAVGEKAPQVDKVRVWYNHPDFIAANTERLQESVEKFSPEDREILHLAFTAHSIPKSMADQCRYEEQLSETCRLIAEKLGIENDRWQLVYQSRSGRPQDPWLEPDICDHLRDLKERGVENVIIHPVGFLSDHMEVLYDLDDEAAGIAKELGQHMERAATVGTHPTFVSMLRKLIAERLNEDMQREAVGDFGPSHDVCPLDCCPAPVRPVTRPAV